jgi:hypothetical protein
MGLLSMPLSGIVSIVLIDSVFVADFFKKDLAQNL